MPMIARNARLLGYDPSEAGADLHFQARLADATMLTQPLFGEGNG
jgi:hypothetical protein